MCQEEITLKRSDCQNTQISGQKCDAGLFVFQQGMGRSGSDLLRRATQPKFEEVCIAFLMFLLAPSFVP